VIKFDKNACVLVNPKGLPIGSRVLGFVTHELRARQMMKVGSGCGRVGDAVQLTTAEVQKSHFKYSWRCGSASKAARCQWLRANCFPGLDEAVQLPTAARLC
jgi:hypothetical protein